MRTSFLSALSILLLVSTVACGDKTNKSTSAAASSSSSEDDFAPGFVEISFDEDEDDLDDLMGSELMMQAKAECSNIMRLEPAAMMGKLKDPEIVCLEDALRDAERQTHKRKLSLLLMADSWAKGDRQRWDAVVARHLDQIDQSDPDLCYKYALYLSKKGPKNTDKALRWADAALENRTRWSGDTHVARVYSLYRLKARASMKQWLNLEQKFASDGGDDSIKEAVDSARNRTKTLSREWLDYARSSGKDATLAQQICEQAAGSAKYCSDG